jgi:hypothetical protein
MAMALHVAADHLIIGGPLIGILWLYLNYILRQRLRHIDEESAQDSNHLPSNRVAPAEKSTEDSKQRVGIVISASCTSSLLSSANYSKSGEINLIDINQTTEQYGGSGLTVLRGPPES